MSGMLKTLKKVWLNFHGVAKQGRVRTAAKPIGTIDPVNNIIEGDRGFILAMSSPEAREFLRPVFRRRGQEIDDVRVVQR